VAFDLMRVLAPLMSFTCDEAYGFLPHRKEESVFLCGLPEPKAQPGEEELVARFDRLLAVRSEVQKALEGARRDKLIGSSLEAKVVLTPSGELGPFLKAHSEELAALFIVSKAELAPGAADGPAGVTVRVERAPGEKCPRCWNFSEAIGEARPVCPKCVEALAS
jgi:isoleucyl-tRNA synthetase